MDWKKVPKQNEETLDRLLGGVEGAERKKMFGCPVYFLNGHMLAGAHQDAIFLRLPEADQDEILANQEVSHFTPMPGRMMREYIVIPPSIYGSEGEFNKWLERARAYVASLPPKSPAGRRRWEPSSTCSTASRFSQARRA